MKVGRTDQPYLIVHCYCNLAVQDGMEREIITSMRDEAHYFVSAYLAVWDVGCER
jgi:hypothetical protein